VKSKWLLTIGDHPIIRKLYRDFDKTVLNSSISCQKVITGKRRSLRNLVIRNYEPPKTPLYAPVAGEIKLLDLFGLEVP
jgi:flagellar biosynthesis protein FliP